MAMPQTVPPKEKASETFAFEFQKTQRILLQTLLSQRACPLRLTFVRQIPPFVAARHLPPARGKSFLKGRGLGKEMKFVWIAKGSPFGRAGNADRH